MLKDEPKAAIDEKRSQRSHVRSAPSAPFKEIVTPMTAKLKKLSYNKTVDFTKTIDDVQAVQAVQVRKSLTTPNFAVDSKQIFNFSKVLPKNLGDSKTSSVHISHQRH